MNKKVSQTVKCNIHSFSKSVNVNEGAEKLFPVFHHIGHVTGAVFVSTAKVLISYSKEQNQNYLGKVTKSVTFRLLQRITCQ